ncbi:hypothetical protein KUL42_17770 [Alteromonas sp. KUL42]|nr:hypothetical protein KUL42_17770 [Alteromonas sp. KUL42]
MAFISILAVQDAPALTVPPAKEILVSPPLKVPVILVQVVIKFGASAKTTPVGNVSDKFMDITLTPIALASKV